METYKILGIVLVFTGLFDMVVLPRIIVNRMTENTQIVTTAIWIAALLTMAAGAACFFGVFGEF
jgi:hypothetical protein